MSVSNPYESATAADPSTPDVESSISEGTAGVAKDQAAQLGDEVGERAKAVAGQASQQARATLEEARLQARRLTHQTQGEMLAQADAKSAQAADALQSIASQMQAVADGRPDEAGPLVGYVQQASDRVGAIAERLQLGGAQGALDDMTTFARRRPGLFLLGAVGAGFLAGRLVRSGKAATDQHNDNDDSDPSTASPAPARPTLEHEQLAASPALGDVLAVPSAAVVDESPMAPARPTGDPLLGSE